MKTVKTYTATIYCGLLNTDTGRFRNEMFIYDCLQEYCDNVGLCVNVKFVDFIYTCGNEPGYAVTLINYPRFPATRKKIKRHAIEIAKRLLKDAGQKRISVVCSDKTYMLGE